MYHPLPKEGSSGIRKGMPPMMRSSGSSTGSARAADYDDADAPYDDADAPAGSSAGSARAADSGHADDDEDEDDQRHVHKPINISAVCAGVLKEKYVR